MAGRLDSATHAASIAKLSEAAKHSTELRQHLTEIVNGPAFKGSQRSQDFLKYIVESALGGAFEDLRERSIGIALFGKAAAYDTSEDAVVRVTASDVRKRLLQHYGEAGAASNFRIDLPSGSYVPSFRWTNPVAAPASEFTATSAVEARTVESAEPVSVADRSFPWRVVAIVALALQAVTLAWWLVASRGAARVAPSSNFISAAMQSAPGSVQLILGDDGLLLIEVLLNRRFTLGEYENQKYRGPQEALEKKGLGSFWESLSTRQLTNLGNLQNAVRVAEVLRGHNWSVGIRHARQVHARDLRSGNFILLGSSHANPWAALFQGPESNFKFESALPGKWATIRNRKPLAGEPPSYEVGQDEKTGKTITYAHVSLVENSARNGRVLLLAGQSTSATELAGEFLLRADSAAKALRMMKLAENSPLPDLEMILRVTEVNGTGDSVTLVACRTLPERMD